MRYDLQVQTGYVTEPVRARFAMVAPILRGMLYSTKHSIIEQAGGYDQITLEMFCRIYNEHPGDYGICFEYSVHNAIRSRVPSVYQKVGYVLDYFCKVGSGTESILFGAEKSGSQSILESAKNILTDASKLLPGTQARPTFLKRHIDNIAAAMRNTRAMQALPVSIRGVWKADLFLGNPQTDYWVATTLKTNRLHIEEAPGLRIAIYPEERFNEEPRQVNNLIHCPLPYNGEFMTLFGATFQIIKQIIACKCKMPSRVALVYGDDQAVAKWLTDRANFPVMDILFALEAIKQVDLISGDAVEDTVGNPDVVASAPIPIITA